MTIHKKFVGLQNLLYQFHEFAESRFHVAAEVYAQRAAIAVG